MRWTLRYAVVGAVLSVGAPSGWWLCEAWLLRSGASAEQGRAWLFLYLTVSTVVVLATFGARLGHQADALEAARARQAEAAATDGLTGLRNARDFHQRLEEAVASARRGAVPLSLLMMDLDWFKRVNDRHGHACGDRVLASAAEALRGVIRASDVACRVGGEEFAVVCPATSAEQARVLAERVRAQLEQMRVAFGQRSVCITASFGVTQWLPGQDPDALFAAADRALYAAKAAGRNRVVAA